jgi:hypothetical protein
MPPGGGGQQGRLFTLPLFFSFLHPTCYPSLLGASPPPRLAKHRLPSLFPLLPFVRFHLTLQNTSLNSEMRFAHSRTGAHLSCRRTGLAPLALLALSLVVQSTAAAPAGPLRLAAELSGFVDGLSADINALVTGNFTHIVVGGGNCESPFRLPERCKSQEKGVTVAEFVWSGVGLAAGLALAARLSEDSSTTVLVIEAGTRQEANTGIIIPAEAGSTFGSDIDWVCLSRASDVVDLNGIWLCSRAPAFLGWAGLLHHPASPRQQPQDLHPARQGPRRLHRAQLPGGLALQVR